MAVRTVTIWSVAPGRVVEFLGLAAQAKVIQERLGGKCRLARIAFGGPNSGQMVYTIEHASLEVLADFDGRLAVDPDWQKLIATGITANANPSATILSHSIAADMPGF